MTDFPFLALADASPLPRCRWHSCATSFASPLLGKTDMNAHITSHKSSEAANRFPLDWPEAIAFGRSDLAPDGTLRVGVYRGSPSSYLQGAEGELDRGVGFLLGRSVADALGVVFRPIVFPKNADVLAAVEAAEVDLVFTNATPARARFIEFTDALVDVEKSILVPGSSPHVELAALEGLPLRIGINVGSSTGTELKPRYPFAELVPIASLDEAARLLSAGQLDGFATNKAILFELADQVPGARVLPGAWGHEHFALGTPRGRMAGREFLHRFAKLADNNGRLREAVAVSRLRGTAPPQT